MNQQSRQILFIALSIVILGAMMYFMPQPPALQAPAASAGKPAGTSASSSGSVSSSASVEKKSVVRAPAAHVAPKEVTVETDDYIATFSNQGAVLTGFRLKKYENRQTHQPIQLVNQDPTHPKPFSISYAPLPDLNQRFFEVEGSSQKLSKADEKAKLVFRAAGPEGTVLEKTFSFKNGTYLMGFDVTVSQSKGSVAAASLGVEWDNTLGKEENTGTNSRVQGYRVATYNGEKVSSEGTKKAQENVEIAPPVVWTGLANQFFMAALIPDPASGGASAKVLRDYHVYTTPTQENPNPQEDPKIFGPRPVLVFAGPALKSGESFQRKSQVFFGPQDYSILKSLNLQLENEIDFGMFGFISVYMLKLLQWFFTWSHNWGLAIILLSLAVKLALWLPTHNSYKNMYLMQQKNKEMQPKIDAIKRKYAEDKKKQQEETMKVYQAAGLNPLSGCLPMLLQMPIFIALYSTLSHSIELRGASFLWLHDLSLRDPSTVFSFLMAATMFAQQKVSGQMANQAAGQQKMMMWMMPIILGFVSKDWPSGLLVYWVVTNLLSMLQQKIVNLEIQKAKKKDEGVQS